MGHRQRLDSSQTANPSLTIHVLDPDLSHHPAERTTQFWAFNSPQHPPDRLACPPFPVDFPPSHVSAPPISPPSLVVSSPTLPKQVPIQGFPVPALPGSCFCRPLRTRGLVHRSRRSTIATVLVIRTWFNNPTTPVDARLIFGIAIEFLLATTSSNEPPQQISRRRSGCPPARRRSLSSPRPFLREGKLVPVVFRSVDVLVRGDRRLLIHARRPNQPRRQLPNRPSPSDLHSSRPTSRTRMLRS